MADDLHKMLLDRGVGKDAADIVLGKFLIVLCVFVSCCSSLAVVTIDIIQHLFVCFTALYLVIVASSSMFSSGELNNDR
jgi:hypothetical protein